jgi:hypothetical protein
VAQPGNRIVVANLEKKTTYEINLEIENWIGVKGTSTFSFETSDNEVISAIIQHKNVHHDYFIG